MDTFTQPLSLNEAHDILGTLRTRLRYAVRGRDREIELVLIALLADAHVLLEDFPGSGKTTLAKALGESIDLQHSNHDPSREAQLSAYRRIQFTPDMLPSDITGTYILDLESGNFSFRAGPLFAHIVLADEINRTSPKVQAALLEAMGEKQVTIDNTSHRLGDLFFVIATQNPRDQAGTYPLPQAQQDRFLFKIAMKPISIEHELEVVRSFRERRQPIDETQAPKVTVDQLLQARKTIDSQVYISPKVQDTLVYIADALRKAPEVTGGVSTRSLILTLPALQVQALLAGRNYVIPDDLAHLLPHIYRHRLELKGGHNPEQITLSVAQPFLEKLRQENLQP